MRRRWLPPLFLVSCSIQNAFAQSDEGFDVNPVLAMQPSFARSLPVQILLNGIVLALSAVLLFHLLFTAQYHWPLAPLNFGLQLSGVLSLLVSLIATLFVILSSAFQDTQEWPYMIKYIAKEVPPISSYSTASNKTATVGTGTQVQWTTAELAGWYAMDATTSALVQITHIQFLTLLYPSQLEQRLILFLLGPLAVLSAAMELLPIHQNQTTVDVADTIRNTCNAALSLLFTAALFLWGFAINRKGAWRTDGGTAAFGGAALALALISTALNFLYIPTKDQYLWLPSLIWAVVLWQSFLGWWWWVGGGRGVGEVEELLRREERRERKRKLRAARRTVRKEKAQALWRNASETLRFSRRGTGSTSGSGSSSVVPETTSPGEQGDVNDQSARARPGAGVAEAANVIPSSASSVISSPQTTTETSSIPSNFFSRLRASPPFSALSQFYHLLRRAHLAAAHSQALERMRKRGAVYGNEVANAAGYSSDGRADADIVVRDTDVVGWGLGSFGLRERERRENELAQEFDMEELVSAREADADLEADVDAGDPDVGRTRTRIRGMVKDARRGEKERSRSRAPRSAPPPTRESWSLWWMGPLRRWRLQDSTAY
ncbi:hypothetical protein ACEPAI_8521 [Sanghuangporus weigelae]